MDVMKEFKIIYLLKGMKKLRDENDDFRKELEQIKKELKELKK